MADTPQRNPVTRDSASVEQVLELYYEQLMHWGTVLTQGDQVAAQDAVHDLCLYFTVAQPDLSRVENLDGYLYTSLRNIYLSSLARVAREATQSVSLTDFDSVYLALTASDPAELLEAQNDLRRICNYAVWRKEADKSASYLILLFFHGYPRRDVAAIAGLPIAAIYNKLKNAREEVKQYLAQAKSPLHASLQNPPQPTLRQIPVSSLELFTELRRMIFAARHSDCLSEPTLLGQYRSPTIRPIPRTVLAHVVSCAHCLELINRHFQWPDLEGPIPPTGTNNTANEGMGMEALPMTYEMMMRSVRRQANRISDHRPKTLSLAINGKVAALYDVQGKERTISTHSEKPKGSAYIEVFTEGRIRLALLLVDDQPPTTSYIERQRVLLSDNRWLELRLRIDGSSLKSEVTYFDPILDEPAIVIGEDEAEESAPVVPAPASSMVVHDALSWQSRVLGYVQRLISPRGLAWTTAIILALGIGGVLTYRLVRPSLDADQILSRSIESESAALLGNAQHETMRIEMRSADGHVRGQGIIDLWTEGKDGRFIRKLYNAQHTLLAAEWSEKSGIAASFSAPAHEGISAEDRQLANSRFWRTDLSTADYRERTSTQQHARRTSEGYELTSKNAASGDNEVIQAVLELDRDYRPTVEIIRLRGPRGISEVHLVRTSFELRPKRSVPDSVYSPSDFMPAMSATPISGNSVEIEGAPLRLADGRLVTLQIAALYELNRLAADTGDPISVTRTDNDHVIVSGTVADSSRCAAIQKGLESLSDRQLLDIHIVPQADRYDGASGPGRISAKNATVYDFAHATAPADPVLSRYYSRNGFGRDQMKSAMEGFSRDALGHAQRALQHAYALERLGASFTPAELQTAPRESQWMWAAMAAQHAAALESELGALRNQLQALGVPGLPISAQRSEQKGIAHPEEFAHAAYSLLGLVQTMNTAIGNTFTASTAVGGTDDSEKGIAEALQTIPTVEAQHMAAFTSRLAGQVQPKSSQAKSRQ